MKDYTNPDGTPVEFRVLEPTLSVLNLPVPIEAQYIKFKIQVGFFIEVPIVIVQNTMLVIVKI